MTASGLHRTVKGQRIALLLVLCALLMKAALPAGWMPQASANGLTLGWCSGTTHAVPTEASALLADALGKPKSEKPSPDQFSSDQPCAFAAAAQPLASADPLSLVHPATDRSTALYRALPAYPGRGLSAPPPFATGPPLHT